MFTEVAMTNLPRCDVVIVEDEPVSRRALASLVTRIGFTTGAYSTAEEALLAIAIAGIPSIVLVDLDLPGMSGIEFIRRLERSSDQVFPVLITAAGTDVVERVHHRRPLAYLRKPLDFGRLLQVLGDRHLRN